ncbi:hypothetical protein IP81_01675 [Novosphingobium sp. AAP83]|nr:hypothetical protein IP81_01675 [Novosphingobium sp. AAP83]
MFLIEYVAQPLNLLLYAIQLAQQISCLFRWQIRQQHIAKILYDEVYNIERLPRTVQQLQALIRLFQNHCPAN